MTPISMKMMTRTDFAALGAPDLVYVREVRAGDLLAEKPGAEFDDPSIGPDAILFALHGADGQMLAITLDRDSAFAAAVAQELEPVSVH